MGEPRLSVESAGAARLTRRRWIGAAGAAGLAGAVGSALSGFAPSIAGAQEMTGGAIFSLDCGFCYCCSGTDSKGRCQGIFCCISCRLVGFTGGGVVQTPLGAVQASFCGNKVPLKGGKQIVVGGALTWSDPAWRGTGLHLQSTQILSYGHLPGTTVRELVGLATANGSGRHRFVLHALDAGAPGSGKDTVKLIVSGVSGGGTAPAGPHYVAGGRLAQGDITTGLQAAISVK
jgi:hypothetical protein